MQELSVDEIRRFQANHKNHLGRPLKIDGNLGPQTQWARAVQTLCAERRAILRGGQQYLGLIEDPPRSNSDPRGLILGWLKMCGAKPGDPWCAAYASHILSLGLGRPIKQAGALALARMFPETSNPVAGDLASFATEGGHGHVFIVAGVSPIGTAPAEVMGFEGNCNNCCCVTRRPFDELRYWRTVPDIEGENPGIVLRPGFNEPEVPLILRNVTTR